MQFYEIILATATVAGLAALLFGKKGNLLFFICTLIQLAALVMHFVQSGLRWQMSAFYFAFVIFLVAAVFKCLHVRLPRMKRFVSVLLVIIFVCMLAASSLLSMLLPVISLPEPTGAYRVGTLSFHLVDSSRLETYTADPDDVRELMVSLWYPAEASSDDGKAAYVPEMDQVAKVFTAQGIPGFLLDTVRNAQTHAIYGAAVSDEESVYPVLIFSHGMGISRHLYTSFAEELASQGYVVAAIDHTYSTMATAFPDGRTTAFVTDVEAYTMEENAALLNVWVQDISFVLLQLDKWNKGMDDTVLNGKLDLDHVGAFGHSFGGAAAYVAGSSNEKIKASVNLDGSIYATKEQLGGMAKPVMIMASEDYAKAILDSANAKPFDSLPKDMQQEMADAGVTREQYDSALKATYNAYQALKQGLDKGGLLVSIKGSKHYNFTDTPLISPLVTMMGMSGQLNGLRGIEVVNAYVSAFFNHHLKDNAISYPDLMASNPESVIEELPD